MGPTMPPGPFPLGLKVEIQARRVLCLSQCLRTDVSAQRVRKSQNFPAVEIESVCRAYFADAKGGGVWLVGAGKNCFIRSGLSCKREITRLI